MIYRDIPTILAFGLKGRQYIIESEKEPILENINDDECIITYDKEYEWNEKGFLIRILDDKEPITLETIKQLKIELEDKERFKLLRELRDRLLKETDYLMNGDYPHKEGMLEKWKQYRQALRDLPNNSNPLLNEKGELDINSIVLPIKP